MTYDDPLSNYNHKVSLQHHLQPVPTHQDRPAEVARHFFRQRLKHLESLARPVVHQYQFANAAGRRDFADRIAAGQRVASQLAEMRRGELRRRGVTTHHQYISAERQFAQAGTVDRVAAEHEDLARHFKTPTVTNPTPQETGRQPRKAVAVGYFSRRCPPALALDYFVDTDIARFHGSPTTMRGLTQTSPEIILVVHLSEQRVHQPSGVGRAFHQQPFLAALQPGGQNDIVKIADVVEMVVRQYQPCQPGEIGAGLRQSMDRATSGIDQNFLLAGAQQQGGGAAGRVPPRPTGAQQSHTGSGHAGGRCATTAPVISRCLAIRKAMSSRQGGAMICTPTGMGPATGTATTGSPMNEIGCVKRPRLARTGSSTPFRTNVFCPIDGAAHGVAGAMIASTSSNRRSTAR